MGGAFYLLWLPAGLIWLASRRHLTLPAQGLPLWRVLWGRLVQRVGLRFGDTYQTLQMRFPGRPPATCHPAKLGTQVPRSLETPTGCWPTLCTQRTPWLLLGSSHGLWRRSGLRSPTEPHPASRKQLSQLSWPWTVRLSSQIPGVSQRNVDSGSRGQSQSQGSRQAATRPQLTRSS